MTNSTLCGTLFVFTCTIVLIPFFPFAVTMDAQRYSLGAGAVGVERKSRWRRLLTRYRFDSAELETLYQRYIVQLRVASVVALLVLFLLLTATLGVLKLNVTDFVATGDKTVILLGHY